MQKIIAQKLNEAEKSENIRILYAVESGSRAWGFASPDSDYDVRFIYVRPLEYYLKLEQTKDVLDLQLDQTLDINGWDLQKALRLLRSSNPTVFEWANSPLCYKTSAEWRSVNDIIPLYFSVNAGFHHYYNMASGNYREYLKGDEVKAKKYLYVLRPILACKWILREGSPPPILFDALVRAELEKEMLPVVDVLLAYKSRTPDAETMPKIARLNEYIDQNLSELKQRAEQLPKKSKKSADALNEIFVRILKGTS
jgi:predicted nucleotidyltransferase